MVVKGGEDGEVQKVKWHTKTILCDTGASKSTPTAAVKVILDLPPLQIYVQRIAKSTA